MFVFRAFTEIMIEYGCREIPIVPNGFYDGHFSRDIIINLATGRWGFGN
jgi:hypothetical protein